jgi:hypothetical protein
MAVRHAQRYAILVARESGVPAQYMFHIAHELGHIALGHLRDTAAIVDADPNDLANADERLIRDSEEEDADAYAQELLTGQRSFTVDRRLGRTGSAAELASQALLVGANMNIDPGHVVMTFGHTTGDWPLAITAAKQVPGQEESLASLVNRVLWSQLGDVNRVAELHFLRAVAPI